jgi:subtilisin family serine protease
MKVRSLSIALALAAAMSGCARTGLPLGMASVSSGKFLAKALHGTKNRFSKHELVVRMAPGARPPVAGARVKLALGDRQVHTLPSGMTLEQAMAAYQASPAVQSIERLELFPVEDTDPADAPVLKAPAPELAANDPMLFQQWSHVVANVPHAWELERGRPEVVVGVLDTGVDANHPDLKGSVIDGPDFAENKDSSPDIDEHGTHVAGIIAAHANNGIGVAGIAPNVKILALKIFEPYFEDGQFQGTFYNAFTLARAIQYAVTQGGVKIINVSAGIADDEILQTMFSFARGRGVIMCVSAGNNGNNVYTGGPKSMDGVLVSHATDPQDRLARFSNYGNTMAVSAPGLSILSTVPTYPNPYTGEPASKTGYESLSGTSMASPFTAGVAALVVSGLMDQTEAYFKSAYGKDVHLTPEDIPGTIVEDLIRNSCKDLGQPGRDEVFGCGRIDAGRALENCYDSNWVERTAKEIQRNGRR